ncbi:hypothetical protein ACQEU6_46235 [Spirillospora sp. CA-108201]
MSWQEGDAVTGDAVRAGILTAFALFGASVVAGVLMEGGPARLALSVLAPLTSLLVGVHSARSARDGGGR